MARRLVVAGLCALGCLFAGCVVEPEHGDAPEGEGPIGTVQEELYGIGHLCSLNSDCTSGHCCSAPDSNKYCTTNCCPGSCYPYYCSEDCYYDDPYDWYYRGCCTAGYSWCDWQQTCLPTSSCSWTCYLAK
jgi:hypothetical protein